MENGNVPVCAGSPEIAPVAAFNVRPGGSAPPLMVHVYGRVPPVAATESEYGAPVLAVASVVVVMSNCGAAEMLHCLVAVAPDPSRAWTVNNGVPVAVGVPETSPESDATVRPDG